MKKLIAMMLSTGILCSPLVYAQDEQSLKLPDDVAQNASETVGGQVDSVPQIETPENKQNAAGEVVEEFRSGGRLERVTIERDNGIEEVYQNKRNDALWNGAENELGDAKNVRSWKVGSW